MDVKAFADLGPARVRDALPVFLGAYVDDPVQSAKAADAVRRVVAAWDDEAVRAVLAHLATLGDEHRIYRADPRCRVLAREWSAEVVLDPALSGAEHLADALDKGPTLILGNHLSYVDTIAQDYVLAAHGRADLADRIVTVAGPKVYAELFRRTAAASLNTLPVPQSTSLEHTEQLSPRELARRALESLESARAVHVAGDALQIYPEGSRSRTGRLGPFLRGIHRYLAFEGLRVVPGAVMGTDTMFPVDAARLRPGPVKVAFGPSFAVSDVGGPKAAISAAFDAVAALLPPALAPTSGTPRIR